MLQLRPKLTGVGGRRIKDRGQGPAVAVGQRSRDQLVLLGLDLADQLGKDHERVRGADLPSRRSALDLRGEQTVAVLVDKVEVDHVDGLDRGRVRGPLDPAAVDPFLIRCGQHRFERAQVLVLKSAGCHPAAVHPHHRTPYFVQRRPDQRRLASACDNHPYRSRRGQRQRQTKGPAPQAGLLASAMAA
ncbi:hypothetical protein [Streptomyces sp. ID05-47C]|uniref:hypothetical protein n=1 Tax=Streptomyces sp. ID05-47C TaxID=3028665 RepID=UPI0029A2EE17|nr:hypothetical protein [Streptomyces sp. ID05-47C]MDX3568735.1 hypothetical protein [Streptomyces sp. ID05-47C]